MLPVRAGGMEVNSQLPGPVDNNVIKTGDPGGKKSIGPVQLTIFEMLKWKCPIGYIGT